MSASVDESGNSVTADRAVSEAIIEAVAAVDGDDPLDMTPPLAAAIDADAIDALYESASGDATLAIDVRIWDHAVRVGPDGRVFVDGEQVTTVSGTE